MLKQSLVTLAVISSLAIGCAKKSPQPSLQKQQKPLPSNCGDTVSHHIEWTADRTAYSYTVSLGLRPYDFYEVYKFSGKTTEVELTLQRDLTYYVRVEKQKTDYQISTTDFTFYIPTCAHRAEWKAKNPDYTEPRVDIVEF